MIQWNLRIKDTLGTINSAVLSFIERLSSFRGSKCTKTIGHVIFGTSNDVLCRGLLYSVPISEGPLSDVPLYYNKRVALSNNCKLVTSIFILACRNVTSK